MGFLSHMQRRGYPMGTRLRGRRCQCLERSDVNSPNGAREHLPVRVKGRTIHLLQMGSKLSLFLWIKRELRLEMIMIHRSLRVVFPQSIAQ
jgi:hypothetical protein